MISAAPVYASAAIETVAESVYLNEGGQMLVDNAFKLGNQIESLIIVLLVLVAMVIGILLVGMFYKGIK